MAVFNSYKFCPGTFFSLLIKARKNGSNDNVAVTEVNMFDDLMKIGGKTKPLNQVGDPDGEVNKVKGCKRPSSSWLCFGNPNYITNYKFNYEKNYAVVVSNMNSFISKYLDTSTIALDRVCQALLELIVNDNTIVDTATFDVGHLGEPIAKKDLLKKEKFYTQYFLLGVWSYLILHPDINNLDGQDTIAFIKDNEPEIFPFKEETPTLRIDFEVLDKKNVDVDIPKSEEKEYFIPDYLDNYLSSLREEFSSVKPLFFNKPYPFYSLFVHSSLISKANINGARAIIEAPTPLSIKEKFGKYIIFGGKGGLGKSMMMHHFVLDSIDNLKVNKMIPFFIPLKDFTSQITDFVAFSTNNMYGADLFDLESFKIILSEGRALLLLDGLDEIKTAYKEHFQRILEQFISKYPDNMYIISSRGVDCFDSFTRFTELSLSPLTCDQATELISKIDYDPDIKTKFIEELKKTLYREHHEFASNPMMLTIMFMTYELYAEVPEKMHLFFSEAYDVIAAKHDAHKKGYKRLYHTKLTADRFKIYLSLFATSLYLDEKVDFTKDELTNVINEIKENIDPKNEEKFTSTDFLNDLDESLCLLRKNGERYEFANPGFSEYFVAFHFSQLRDEDLESLVPYFEKKEGQVLQMLYDMKKDHVSDYLILPYLDKLLEEASHDEDGIMWGFVKIVYPTIRYSKGDCWGYDKTESDSPLYRFIRKAAGIDWDLDNIGEWAEQEDEKDFITNYVYHSMEPVNAEIRVPVEDLKDVENPPVPVGYDVEIDTKYLLMEKDKYVNLIGVYEDDYQGLGDEFNAIVNYLEDLKTKKASRPTGRKKLLF